MAGKPHYVVTIDYLNQAFVFNARCEQVAEFLLDSEDARDLISQGRRLPAVDEKIWDISLDWISEAERQKAAYYVLPDDVRVGTSH